MKIKDLEVKSWKPWRESVDRKANTFFLNLKFYGDKVNEVWKNVVIVQLVNQGSIKTRKNKCWITKTLKN